MNLANLKIGVRLGMGYSAVLLLLVVVMVVSIINLTSLNTGINSLVKEHWVKAKLANQALDATRGSMSWVFQLTIATEANEVAVASKRLRENTEIFDSALAKLDAMPQSDEN